MSKIRSGDTVKCFDETSREFLGIGIVDFIVEDDDFEEDQIAWVVGDGLNYFFIVEKLDD